VVAAYALCAVADVLSWGADKLLAPILTGVAVGLGLRAATVPGEVSDHDAQVEALNTDLTRWVRDRPRELNGEIFRALNLARLGIIEDLEQPPVPKELEDTKPGSQEYSGAFVAHVERLMRQSPHQYRDRASGTVRAYRAMARSEERYHRFLRQRRGGAEPSPLRLPQEGRDALASWREREVPVTPIPGMARPRASAKDDPTLQDDAADIRPLEDEADGLTWEAARST
jgi:hypothetical protein